MVRWLITIRCNNMKDKLTKLRQVFNEETFEAK